MLTPSVTVVQATSPPPSSRLASVLSNPPPLKDHFTVINHKHTEFNGQHQHSIFEPKSASTPIYREHKTSTPNLLNRTLLENVLYRLAGSSDNLSDNYAVIPGVTITSTTV